MRNWILQILYKIFNNKDMELKPIRVKANTKEKFRKG